jgi:UDP-arabinose 4-epimerase
MTTVLVTGGAGFIGSHAAKALKAAGFAPVVLDNLSTGHAHAVKWGPLVRGDVLDARALDLVFAKYAPRAVLHFAALSNVGESVAQPYRYFRTNVAGTINLLEAMHRAGCKDLVFSSTCAIFGVPETLPIGESCPQGPVNPYGASKEMTERIMLEGCRANGLRVLALRYFNAAGSDPDGEIGEEHEPETHLIPLALQAAQGRRRLKIFGSDYDTPDGSCIRDYVHVSDLAHAHVLALLHLLDRGVSTAFNLGTGRGYSVFEVLNTVESVTGQKIVYEMAPRRVGDPPVLVADPRRAFEHLGWTPRFPDLKSQIEHAWAFSVKNELVGL